MQAVGLRLEENGAVLALGEDGQAPGAKWDQVPASVLQRLDTAANVSRRVVREGWHFSAESFYLNAFTPGNPVWGRIT